MRNSLSENKKSFPFILLILDDVQRPMCIHAIASGNDQSTMIINIIMHKNHSYLCS